MSPGPPEQKLCRSGLPVESNLLEGKCAADLFKAKVPLREREWAAPEIETGPTLQLGFFFNIPILQT